MSTYERLVNSQNFFSPYLTQEDLSRFGRDYIETGKYLEEIFPFMGVRFIAVNDNYDSMAERSAADDVVLPFKNLVNDTYAKDISIKVRSSKAVKRRNGDFVGPFAAYGYCKDPENKNQLIIDEGAAETVRQIFSWKLDGMSAQAIADQLNSKGVLSPMEYKQSIGLNFKTSFKLNKMAKWTAVAVLRILKNELYMGTMVQGRETTPNYKVKTRIYQPPEKWSRIANAHEPIISPMIFARVQYCLSLDTRSAPHSKQVYLFSGLLVCADCGQPMIRHPVQRKGKEYIYYVCSSAKCGKKCENHNIREDYLKESVLVSIQARIRSVIDLENLVRYVDALPLQQREIIRLQAQLAQKQEEAERYKRLFRSLYERLSEGILTQNEFLEFKAVYAHRCDEAERAAGALQREIKAATAGTSGTFRWIEDFREHRNLTKLTRKVVVMLIKQIKVYKDQRIHIQFYQENECRCLAERIMSAADGQPAADYRKGDKDGEDQP